MHLESLLPAEIQNVKLGELTQPLRSFGVSRSFTDPSSNMRSLHYGEIFKRGVEAYDGIPYSGLTPKNPDNLEVGDVVFADTAEDYGHVGISTYVKEPVENLTAGTHTQALRPNQERLVPAFLAAYTYTAAWKEHMRKYSTGNTVIAISRSALEKVEIPLPSLEVQNQIVEILNAHSELADLQTERVRLLKLEKDVLLEKIFSPGDGFKFSLGGKSLDTAEWLEYCLADAILYQPAGMSKEDLVPDGPYIVYGAGSIMGRSDRYNHEESKLIVSCRASVGSVQFTEPKSWITSNSMVIDTSSSTRKIDERALGLALMKYHWHNIASGTSQLQLTRDGFKRVKVRLPQKLKDQRLISEYFREIDSRIKLEEERLQLLKTQSAVVLEAIFNK